MSDHNRLITRTAREHLTPCGFFQAGSSRVWLQDNGWFMVMAEFRPSGFSKCSMLTMGLHFLWAHGPEAESEDVSAFHYPLLRPSINQCHAPYTGDDTLFCAHIARFCRVILSETELLRHFHDLSYARTRLAGRASASIWNAYDHAQAVTRRALPRWHIAAPSFSRTLPRSRRPGSWTATVGCCVQKNGSQKKSSPPRIPVKLHTPSCLQASAAAAQL